MWKKFTICLCIFLAIVSNYYAWSHTEFITNSVNDTLLNGKRNLTELELVCPFMSRVQFTEDVFNGLTKLESLLLANCIFDSLTAKHFEDLPKLKNLDLINARFDHIDWLRSEDLARRISHLSITEIGGKIQFDVLAYITKYEKLDTIFVYPKLNETHQLRGRNLFPYICQDEICYFYRNLDRLECPPHCRCEYENRKMHLIETCTFSEAQIEYTVPLKPDIGITPTATRPAAFYLMNTNMTKLPDASSYDNYSVCELHVANNKLDNLTISQLPQTLTLLDIRNNNFQTLSTEVIDFLKQRRDELKMHLSNNSWNCDCHLPGFLKFVESSSENINDFNLIKCNKDFLIVKLEECRLRITYLILGISISFVAICVILCGIIFWFKMAILMWLYDHDIFVSCIMRTADNIEFNQKYDAFLAFSHKNLDLIEEYVERLEHGRREFKLCFYQRDWLIGESIPDRILQSIEDSKRIILLMTTEFVKSAWGTFEFRTAIKATSMNRDKRLIIIVYPEVENFDDLDTELRLYMKYNTYLPRDDSQFWRKLVFAMPHKKMRSTKKKSKLIEDNPADI